MLIVGEKGAGFELEKTGIIFRVLHILIKVIYD